MAERRNSLQPEPAAPRNNKRRRTMMDSVSEVARWLLPSWASEGTSESSPNQHQQTTSGHHQAASSGLSNGERNPKRARTHEAPRRGPMGRLSPVTSMAPSTTSAQMEADFDDGSDSSTSGCSSLSITTPAAAEAADSKNTQRRNRPIQNTKESKTRDVSISVDQTSIAAETSITASPSLNFSLFSRPSRALSSTLNASLPLTGSLSASRSLSSSLHRPERSLNRSIFYEGKTTYGGAAAHRKLNLFSPSPYQMAAKRSKPASNVNVAESSSAAKRLIEALERMNTPVQNAKKIPLARPESALPSSSEARRKEALESIASLRQTSAPPPLSSCRSSVQPARIGNNVKPVLPSSAATSSVCPIDIDGADDDGAPMFKASNVPVITPTPRTLLENYDSDRVASAAGGNGGGGGGKMKSAKTIQQHLSRKIPVEEEAPPAAPDLPAAPLPIKDLPSFSFATKTPSVAVTSTQDCHKTSSIRSPLTSLADFSNKPFEKQQIMSPLVCSTNDSTEAFTFAAPVDLDKPTKTLHCKEEFGFKDPLYLKKDSLNRSSGFTVAGPVMTSGGSFTVKTKAPEVAKPAVAEVLSTGSVMDIIGKVDSRASETANQTLEAPKTNSWECPKCSVRNPSGTCQVCDTKKLSPPQTSTASNSVTTAVTNTWGDQFKKPASSWDCSTCCVNNKSENSACVACNAAKPGAADSSKPRATGSTVANQWGDLFKKPAGQWSCRTCMVDNKADASKCVACESPNPAATKTTSATSSAAAAPALSSTLPISTVKSPLSAMIKMPPGWSCDTCLVRNDVGKAKCVACQSPNPNDRAAAKSQPATGSSLAATPAFKFGVPTSDENKNITTEPVTLVFGMKSTDGNGGNDGSAVPNGFKFGIPSTSTTTTSVEEAKSASAEHSSCTPKGPAASGFSFGAPALAVPPAASQTSASPASAALTPTTTTSAGSATVLATTASGGFGAFSTNWTPTQATAANKADAAPAASLFAFGTPSTSATSSAAAPKSFAFGMSSPTSTATPSAATFNFGATSAAASNAPPTTTAAAPSMFAGFGGFASPAKAPSSGSLFGATSTASVFGTQTTVTTATSTQPSATTGFSFSTPASSGTAATPAVSASGTVTAAASPMFTFGSPPATAATTAAQNPASTFVFGSTSTALNRPSGFAFGAAAATTTTTALSATPSFTFGATPAAAPASTALPSVSNGPSVFGSGALPSATPAFGASTSNSTAAPATNSVFQFNANPTAAPSPSQAPSFTFNAGGASSGTAPASGGLFAFGAGNNAAVSPSGASAVNPGAATPFLFGGAPGTAAAAPTPAAATAPNDMFNFGQPAPAAATPAGPFQFGAQAPTQPQVPFQFGGAPSNVAPSLNNFAVANGENPFDAAPAGRKIRRALRRRGR